MRLHLQDRGDHCRRCRSQGEGPEEASQLVFSYLRDLLTLQTDSDFRQATKEDNVEIPLEGFGKASESVKHAKIM